MCKCRCVARISSPYACSSKAHFTDLLSWVKKWVKVVREKGCSALEGERLVAVSVLGSCPTCVLTPGSDDHGLQIPERQLERLRNKWPAAAVLATQLFLLAQGQFSSSWEWHKVELER